MAFRGRELARGAFAAWCAFMLLLMGFWFVTGVVSVISELIRVDAVSGVSTAYFAFIALFYAALIGGTVSATATLVGTLPAWFIGVALRRVRAWSIHLLCFGLLGSLVGAGTFALFTMSEFAHGLIFDPLFVVYLLLASAIAVSGGWWFTARRALRDDAQGGAY